jgi:hypothetical protein
MVMKNIAILAMLAGIVTILLALVGVVGQDGAGRPVMVGAVVLLAVGFLLYKRTQRRSA